MKQELDGVKKSLREVEKSLEAAWDSINDIQVRARGGNLMPETIPMSGF